MSVSLKDFKRRKDFLICVDSDGCAMDTMDIKHFRCFGPCMIEEWGLEKWSDVLLPRWNEINLYTITRGINRFLGLAIILREIHEHYCPIDGIEELEAWTQQTKELSNASLKAFASSSKSSCPSKALSWSMKVNASINTLPDDEKKPFSGVLEGLSCAHQFSDIAVVSSANKEAVEEEWKRFHMINHVDVLCCQDSGSKAHCIEVLKNLGYAPDHILMIGDAPGDADAASQNGVYYYPVLVKHEVESWKEFHDTALVKFRNGSYEPYGKEVFQQFLSNLGHA
ncbi:MAG: HAD family hydrolase [Lachnospirales bacterium]